MPLALSLALALSASPPAPPPAAEGAFPYPVHRRALDNGLRVLFVPYDAPGLAAYFTFFRVGSRDEVEPGRSGFAHFFEHLTFRGTRNVPAAAWEQETKSLGFETNAFTSDDVTAYWASGPSAALPRIVELEADRFMNLAYGEDDFKVEARAVLGELLKSVAAPEFTLEEAVRGLSFTRHPYRHTTLGFEKDVRDMPTGYRYSLELYRRFYRPDNAHVLVVGDFDEERVFDAIRRFYGPWKGAGASPPVPVEPPAAGPREARHGWPTPALPRVWTGWRTPSAADLDAAAAQLVLWPYLFGRPSALYRELVLERRLVQEVGGEFQPRRDPYLFGCTLVLESAAAEAPARAAVDRAVAEVAGGKIDEALLADVRAHVLATLAMQTDTPRRTGVWLVFYTAVTGDPGYLDALMARVARVGPAELTAFARRSLVPQNRSTVVVAHEGGGKGGSR